jgi:hypothetical protein
MRTLLLLLLLCPPQDNGRINLDRTGTIEEAAQDLAAASGTSIRVLEGVDPKAFTTRVTKVGFFEALDAICRAHGKASYLVAPRGPEEGQIDIRPVNWLEYPSCYVQDFKVFVSEMAGFSGANSVGSARWNRVFVTVCGPPWMRVQDDGPIKSYWTIDEALDADGRDVRPPVGDPEPAQCIDLVYSPKYHRGNVASRAFRLKPFDVDRGLQVLKGGIRLSVSGTEEVTLPLIAGKTVETPAGTLTVDAVREPEKTPRLTTWRASLTLKPAKGVKGLRQAFENRFRCDGADVDGRLFALSFPRDGWSFEVVIRGASALPASVRLMAREGDRRIDVPFEFKNVRF